METERARPTICLLCRNTEVYVEFMVVKEFKGAHASTSCPELRGSLEVFDGCCTRKTTEEDRQHASGSSLLLCFPLTGAPQSCSTAGTHHHSWTPAVLLPSLAAAGAPHITPASSAADGKGADVKQSDARLINLLMFTEFFELTCYTHSRLHTGHV